MVTNDIQRSLGRIEGGIQAIKEELQKINQAINEHNRRIDGLETFRDEQKGKEKSMAQIASIVGALAGGFVTAVIWIVSKFFKNL